MTSFLFFLETVIFTMLFPRWPTLWSPTLRRTKLFRSCLTTPINVEMQNVVATLIWDCIKSRPYINQKTLLKQRWNVSWERTKKVWKKKKAWDSQLVFLELWLLLTSIVLLPISSSFFFYLFSLLINPLNFKFFVFI